MKKKGLVLFAEIIYLFILFFFCYTAANKLLNLDSFRMNLIKTSLFTIKQANVLSILVIAFEFFVIGVLLYRKKYGLFLSLIMMFVFTIYITYLRYRGLYEVCGCGGVLNGLEYKYHLIINIGLILFSYFSLTVNSYKIEK